MSRFGCLPLAGCAALRAACGSTGRPSGIATGAANGASGDKTRDVEFARCIARGE